MDKRQEDAPPQAAPLVSGHFREGPEYAVWRSRGTNDWLLICTLGGGGRFGFTGGEIYTSAGDFTLLRPGTPHDYKTLKDHWELLWVHFHPEPAWQSLLAWPEAAPGLMTLRPELAPPEKIAGRLWDMHALATGALPRRDALATNALEEALLWCDLEPRPGAPRLDPRIQAVMDLLCRSMNAAPPRDELTAASGLSPSRLSHLFREQVGLTPLQYLEQQRLGRACQLLDFTALSITVVAAEVGFDNPFYFTLRFKRFTGLSPRDYRKRVSANI